MTLVLRGRRIASRAAAGTVVCLAVATALAPGARAADFADGQWYVAPFKLANNHTIADGSGVTVAVLDGVISPSAPSLAGADVVPLTATTCVSADGATATTANTPAANHATAMTAMIVGQGGTNVPLGVAPGAKVLAYTVGFGSPSNPLALDCYDKAGGVNQFDQAGADAITDAVAKGARIISMSYSGKSAQPATQTAILFAERKGVVFVASTDDQPDVQGTRLDPPASFNGVVAVNGIDRTAALGPGSATGSPDGPLVVASAPGRELSLGGHTSSGGWDPTLYSNGSSPATAFVSGVLAATLSKWPKATGNQLIQSLARNTGGDEHGIDARALDGYGYGVVSLTSMLAHDPSGYPDQNPTLRDGAVPSTDDILQGASSGAGTSSSPASSAPATGAATSPAGPPTAQAAARDSGTSTGLIIGLAVGAVVVLALIVLVLVLLTRRGRRGGPPPPTPGPPPPAVAGYHR